MGQTPHHLKNSKDLAQKLKNTKVEPDETFISHDVVSLFTKVPIPQQALDAIQDRLIADRKLKDRTKLSPEDIMDLLKFVCDTTYFVFEGQIYEQRYGTAMGSPVSPVIANLYTWNDLSKKHSKRHP